VSRRRCISKALLLAALAAFLPGVRASAQTPGEESVVKAAFGFNFLKFVEWPPEAFTGPAEPLVVAIVGGGGTADATERFLADKQVGGRPVVVRRVSWDAPLSGVHAAYVSETDRKKLARVLESAAAAGALSIGEGAEFASRGGVIALLIEERRVRFDIDMAAADASGLRISSKLLALTRVVHPGKARVERP
jgi:hypothetical protein